MYIQYVLLYIKWVQNLVKVTTEGGIKVIKNNGYRELVQYKVIITILIIKANEMHYFSNLFG